MSQIETLIGELKQRDIDCKELKD